MVISEQMVHNLRQSIATFRSIDTHTNPHKHTHKIMWPRSEKANFSKLSLFWNRVTKTRPNFLRYIFPTMEFIYAQGGNKLVISRRGLKFYNKYSRI